MVICLWCTASRQSAGLRTPKSNSGDWAEVGAAGGGLVVLSNTGERGYEHRQRHRPALDERLREITQAGQPRAGRTVGPAHRADRHTTVHTEALNIGTDR